MSCVHLQASIVSAQEQHFIISTHTLVLLNLRVVGEAQLLQLL